MVIKIVITSLVGALIAGCSAEEANEQPVGANQGSAVVARSPVVVDDRPVVLFLGTSLTAGYGLPEQEAFPALLQDRMDSLGYAYRVLNAGVSGETSAGGLARLEFLLVQPIAVLVLELGANDGLRGLDIETMRSNLQTIVDRTKAAHPDVEIVVAGMQAPPNLGVRFTTAFRESFVELAEKYQAPLVPFLLDSVAAIPELNQGDGIHPTAEGHTIVARNIWRALEPVLKK
jgi:acyl-CoA thioesterase-1